MGLSGVPPAPPAADVQDPYRRVDRPRDGRQNADEFIDHLCRAGFKPEDLGSSNQKVFEFDIVRSE
jgi:hypothetical protein